MQRVSKIVDAQGQPIQITDSLHGDQTAQLGFIGREFENHPSSGLTPARLAAILTRGEQGELADQCDLFEDMEEKDGHIFAEMSKRKRALLGLNWQIVPPRHATAQETAAAEQLSEWLLNMGDFEDRLFDLADAIGKGYSMLEIAWSKQAGVMLPTLSHRPARWFMTDATGDRDVLLLRNEIGQGDALWPFGWVRHVHKCKSGYVGRSGLHRVLAWPFLFKNYSVRDLAEFLEIYGIPARLGTYPSGSSEEEKATLLRAVVSVGHNAAGIMPEGMMMEFKEAAKGASGPFQAMIEWCESIQSKAILGGTLSATAANTGLGSGQADVQNEVRHDLMRSDARQIAGTLTRDLLWPMLALNITGIAPGRAPRFDFITQEEEDITARATRDKLLFDMGYKLSAARVAEVYGEGYEAAASPPVGVDSSVLATKGAATDRLAAGTVGAESSALALPKVGALGEVPATDIDPTPMTAMTEQLAVDAGASIKAIVDQVAAMAVKAESLEVFRDRLLESYGDLDNSRLTRVMALAFAAADLSGRFDVSEGS
ncbi:MAG: DUF935 domain-containing protein [Methylobacter sp.]|uniref:DUF935 domain-containing protein n=1 Tax=Candidatus Methylobacter titanis TaxID=3053457 RepID=A0AA43Q8Q4_9GAMM|nr:DUF935 domain-containing protein [Candidatus Methylobacter titanis]